MGWVCRASRRGAVVGVARASPALGKARRRQTPPAPLLEFLPDLSQAAHEATKLSAAEQSETSEGAGRCSHTLADQLREADAEEEEISHIGGPIQDCRLLLFTDSDFCWDYDDFKLDRRIVFGFGRASTFAPIAAASKGQTAVSHSSTEAEVIAMECAPRVQGLPALGFGTRSCHCALLVGGILAQAQRALEASEPCKGAPDDSRSKPNRSLGRDGREWGRKQLF